MSQERVPTGRPVPRSSVIVPLLLPRGSQRGRPAWDEGRSASRAAILGSPAGTKVGGRMAWEGQSWLGPRGGWDLAVGQGLCPRVVCKVPPTTSPFHRAVVQEAHGAARVTWGMARAGGRVGSPHTWRAAAPASPPPMQMMQVLAGLVQSQGPRGLPSLTPPALRFPTLMFLETFASVCLCPRGGLGAAPVPTGSCFSDWAGGRGALVPGSTGSV